MDLVDSQLKHSFARRSLALTMVVRKSGTLPLPRVRGSRIVGRSEVSTVYRCLILIEISNAFNTAFDLAAALQHRFLRRDFDQVVDYHVIS